MQRPWQFSNFYNRKETENLREEPVDGLDTVDEPGSLESFRDTDP
jgi:hypothetical protein